MSNDAKISIVVGGSNGIGLAISKNLIDSGYLVKILDICEPDPEAKLPEDKVTYTYCDLTDFDKELFDSVADDPNVRALVITSGIGRVCSFENLHYAEIKKTMRINAESVLEIIGAFYAKIKSDKPFYTCVMGSIAGIVSSPLFSTYAASKAAVYKFCESLNAELAANGISNRILNVSPGSIKGTRFNGGENNIFLLENLAQVITDKMFNSEEIFIPDYEKTFKDVIERYNSDPKAYGLQS